MTELSFLLDLLLNHKLPKATRDLVANRIKEVERNIGGPVHVRIPADSPISPGRIGTLPPHFANQAPSTLAALAKHPDLLAQMQAQPLPVVDNGNAQPIVIAQTPQAAAALAARQESINLALSGKPAPGEKSPRKF